MPGYARKDIVREGEVATYHCWSRCVQRAFLCGYDPLAGRDFDYRRGWIEDLLAYQAGVFALDVGNFNLLSNHAHTILRTRPDIAATWSHEELALRWKLAWPEFLDGQWIREPTDQEIEALLDSPEKLERIRSNLSSLSWFMARWKEPIAKLCNSEMDRTGHFWEARFGSRELLDEAAVLTCSIYVDLNQVRAGMADSLEDSQHSAIRNRILAAKRQEAQASLEAFGDHDSAGSYVFSGEEAEALFDDCWLAPIRVDGPLLTAASLQGSSQPTVPASQLEDDWGTEDGARDDVVAETAHDRGSAGGESERSDTALDDIASPAGTLSTPSPRRTLKLTRRRASDSPIIDVPWSEYLRVLQAVAGLTSVDPLAADGPAESREQLENVLRDWGMNPPAWLVQFEQLDRRCTRVLGAAHHMLQRAGEVAQRWFQGIAWCREIFAGSSSDEFT